MKLSQKSISKSHRALLFGPPKSGKTELAGKLSEVFKVIFVDMENGIDTLKKFPLEWQERIEVISLPDTRSFPIAVETCLKMIRGQKGTVCEHHGKWNCALCLKEDAPRTEIELNALPLDTIVIFDSLTQLTNSAMSHLLKNKPDDYRFEFEDWRNLGVLMDTFLSHVQQAPFHVVCISHETEVEMEDGKEKLVPTAGTRNFSRNTAKYFDEVIYCEVKNKRHIAASSTTYSGNILTGSRSGTNLESQQTASLISIFKGEVIKSEKSSVTPTENTPATKAVSDLSSKLAAMRKNAQ